LIRSQTANTSGRPGIIFGRNSLAFFAGDGDSIFSDQVFGFYSIFSNTRTLNAQLRVYGNSNTWNEYIGLRHDGTNGIVSTDSGSIVLSPFTGKVGIGASSPEGKFDVAGKFYTGLGALAQNNIILRAFGGDEGGQIRFDGAGSYPHFHFDNFKGNLRFVSKDLTGESAKFQILNNGNFGLNFGYGTAPQARMHINSSIANAASPIPFRISVGVSDTLGNAGGKDFTIDVATAGGLTNLVAGAQIKSDGTSGYNFLGPRGASRIRMNDGLIGFYTSSETSPSANQRAYSLDTARVVITSQGKVGIGTTTPQSKLAVNGTVTAKEIVVTNTGWPDFVFADAYQLKPLDEVERYIKQNKHLPDMPSQQEVAENGVSLGEMQSRLLQKIEELTLYMIELKKENDHLRQRVSGLEQQRR